ncbi:MAG: PIN domain-containing protein [Actinomycetota bacterium]|nr:PIN domain-containing protein [Actinomycetota bacterium]
MNVLVYAFRREAPDHQTYANWLAGVVGGEEELALHDSSLSGFVRIVTNPRVVSTPAPTLLVLDFVTRLREARRPRWLGAGDLSWARLEQLAHADRGIMGNLVPDAHLAALALAHGCRVATADRGFARFPGLDWFDPAA